MPPAVAANAPAAPASPRDQQTFGSYQEEALLGHHWSWSSSKANESHPVIQFFEDGSVSAGWHWQWLPKSNGELVVDCFWKNGRHVYLKFDKQFSEFQACDTGGGVQATGKRLALAGENSPPKPGAATPPQGVQPVDARR